MTVRLTRENMDHIIYICKHADILSRTGNDDTEWSIDKTVFAQLPDIYPDMSINLFVSILNAKLCPYVSRYPDWNAGAVNAFSCPWVNK